MANAVSVPRECFPKISELLKRNWPGAAHIKFIKGNHKFYSAEKAKKNLIAFLSKKKP